LVAARGEDLVRCGFGHVALVVGFLIVAANTWGAERGSIGLSVFSGYQTYSLSGINEEVRAPSLLIPGATVEIDGGLGFGAGVRFVPFHRTVIGIDLWRLLASAGGTGIFSEEPYEWDMHIPANAATVTIAYYLLGGPEVRVGLGGGVGYYKADSDINTRSSSAENRAELKGNGLGAHALVLCEIPMSDRFSVEASAGYRWARTKDVEIRFIFGNEHHDSHIDWSGLMTRAGITFYFAE
jgi:hypothetical protein